MAVKNGLRNSTDAFRMVSIIPEKESCHEIDSTHPGNLGPRLRRRREFHDPARTRADRMVRIEHIAIWTGNLERLRDFYVAYFGGAPNRKYVNGSKGFESYFVTFDGGTRLELMRVPELAASDPEGTRRAGLAHFAVSLGSRKAVTELTERLEREGHRIASAPRVTGDGYFESSVLDPDGNRIEITE
jgi:lactoylglutathione lyase